LKEVIVQIVETYWQKPVVVRLQNGLEHTFLSVEDSLDFLENEWPIRNGRHRHRAIDLCRSAMNRTTSSEVAREAFIAACIEAGIETMFVFRRATAEQPRILRLR
jgi:hypothetical protein